MYLGPVDGHDTEKLISLLQIAKDVKRPVLLHVITKKGKGYAPAEEHPKLFHGVGRFDPVSGEVSKKNALTFSDAFGQTMCDLAEKDDRVCAITAAMPGGTGLLDMKKQFPNRLFDVGIAEEHAMSMAAGLAKQGMVPVIALYSTFLQRSYDMILQDVCLMKQHVVIAVDRAGLVGEDGETHHGVFDVGFLRQAPGMAIICPASLAELRDMLKWAVLRYNGPVAVRYPRGSEKIYSGSAWNAFGKTGVYCHRRGEDVTLVTYGTLVDNVMQAADILESRGVRATVLRLLAVSPLPSQKVMEQLSENPHVVIVEETCSGCGVRQALAWDLMHKNPQCKVDGIDLGPNFVSHGKIDELYRHLGLDAESIADYVQGVLTVEN